MKLPGSISFASVINALSIPMLALLLWWTLDRLLSPAQWCPAIEEFKLGQAAAVAALRCKDVLLAQIDVGKYVSIGLVGALALAHLISVAREAKATFDLSTKLGSVKVGGDPEKQAAEHVLDGAKDAAADITGRA